jgi:hypothetical protein
MSTRDKRRVLSEIYEAAHDATRTYKRDGQLRYHTPARDLDATLREIERMAHKARTVA